MLGDYLAICKYNSWIFKEYLVIILEMFWHRKHKKNTNSSSQIICPKYLTTKREDFVIGFVKLSAIHFGDSWYVSRCCFPWVHSTSAGILRELNMQA